MKTIYTRVTGAALPGRRHAGRGGTLTADGVLISSSGRPGFDHFTERHAIDFVDHGIRARLRAHMFLWTKRDLDRLPEIKEKSGV